jgi:5-methylcytosine-specific restriction endonuclease McrA
MNSKEKTSFRRTEEWKQFRITLIKERNNTCELCGSIKPSSQLQVHHINPDDYTNLNKKYFAVLCKSCHKEIERLSKRKFIKEPLCTVVAPFLALSAQKTVKKH